MTPSHSGYIPWASSAATRRTMQGNRRRDTVPELALRSALHRRGWRFRVQYPVPGRPRRSIDIAFTRAKVAVFVDGCFWHGCPDHASKPGTNREYWSQKILRNRARDLDTDEALNDVGWRVLRVWEHEPMSTAVALVEEALAEAPPHLPDAPL